MAYNATQVQAVHNYNTAANAAAIAAQPGSGAAQVTRAAIAAGKVPGVGAHNASNKAVVKALGRQVRQVPRSVGAGVGRGNTYATATTKGNNALAQANAMAAKAAKAKAAAAAKAAKATQAQAKANGVTPGTQAQANAQAAQAHNATGRKLRKQRANAQAS